MYSLWQAFGQCKWGDMLYEYAANRPALTTIQPSERFWFRDAAGTSHGPFYGSAIEKLVEDGLFHVNSAVYVEGRKTEWKPLKTFLNSVTKAHVWDCNGTYE